MTTCTAITAADQLLHLALDCGQSLEIDRRGFVSTTKIADRVPGGLKPLHDDCSISAALPKTICHRQTSAPARTVSFAGTAGIRASKALKALGGSE